MKTALKSKPRSRALRAVDNLERELERQENDMHARRLRIFGKRNIRCEHCKKYALLKKWSFIQGYWHEGPHGCNGGDEWWPDEKETCHIACPHCGEWNYLYNHPQKHLVLEALISYRIWPSDLFVFVYEKAGNNPLKQVHPKIS
jgi:phage FluMu protein Com